MPLSRHCRRIMLTMLPVVFIMTAFALASTSAAIAFADDGAEADSAIDEYAGDIGRQEDIANSWRFADGKPIQEDAAANANAQQARPKRLLKSIAGKGIAASIAKGIDVSEWQGTIDWNAVKASGIQFAIIRCGYGNDQADQDDRQWAANIRGVESAGLPYGVYIYSYATNTAMARSEANHVVRCLKGHSPQCPVYLDMEDDSQASLPSAEKAAIADAFCTAIKNAGFTPGVYASINWWNGQLTSATFDKYERWVAQWNSSCTYGGEYQMWQQSSTGTVPGISGGVDIDCLMDTAAIGMSVSGGDDSYDDIATREVLATSLSFPFQVSNTSASSSISATASFTVRSGSTVIASGTIPAKDITSGSTETLTTVVSGSDLDAAGISEQLADSDVTLTCDIQISATALYAQAINGSGSETATLHLNKAIATPQYCQDVLQAGSGSAFTVSKTGTRMFLDVPAASKANGASIQIWNRNETPAQHFTAEFTDVGDGSGYYQFKNVNSGKYLIFSKRDLVQTTGAGSSAMQRWVLEDSGYKGAYKVVNVGTGQVIDIAANGNAAGTNAGAFDANGTSAQAFVFHSCRSENIATTGSSYYLKSSVKSTGTLDIACASKDSGANLQLFASNGTSAQKFKFSYDKTTGYYTLANTGSGKLLDAAGAGTANGTNIWQYADNGTNAQRWAVIDNGKGVILYNAANGLVADLSAAIAVNGRNIHCWEPNGTAAQRWLPVKAG